MAVPPSPAPPPPPPEEPSENIPPNEDEPVGVTMTLESDEPPPEEPPEESPPEEDVIQPSPPPPPAPRPSRPPGARNEDPLLQFQFSVEFSIDPFGWIPPIVPIKGYFTEVSGLNVEWETTEYKTTNFLGYPHSNHIVGRPVYGQVTLRRGVTDSETFWLWHQLLAFGLKPMLKNYVFINMYDRNYKLAAQWSLERAFPVKVSGPEVRSDSNDVAIEELTLAHGGIMRMFVGPGMQAANFFLQQLP